MGQEPHIDALPSIPCLRPDLSIEAAAGGALVIQTDFGRLSELDVDERGRKVVNRLLPTLLDGSRRLEEVVESCIREGMTEREAKSLLSSMYALGMLADLKDAADHTGNLDPRWLPQLRAWSKHTSRPGLLLRRVRESTVSVFDSIGLGIHVGLGLARSGVGVVLWHDGNRWPQVPWAEATEKDSFREWQEVYQRLGTRLVTWPGLADAEGTHGEIATPHLTIGISSDPNQLAGLNRSCVVSEVPLLCASISVSACLLGPLVLPGSTCFQCLLHRDPGLALSLPVTSVGNRRPLLVGLPTSWLSIAAAIGTFALLAITHLGEHPLRSAVLRVDASSLAQRGWPILKVARCPACSRGDRHPEGTTISPEKPAAW